MHKVSVVIASYNHEKYIGYAIESVLNQTYQDFEIIIVDDSSTDGTIQVVKQFSDSRLKLYCSSTNDGQFATVRKAIEKSQGEYIAILNSDDAFAPDKLKKQVEFLDSNPCYGAVFSYARLIDEEGHDFHDENNLYYDVYIQPNRSRYEWLNFFFFNGNCFIHPSCLIRRECHQVLGLYKEHFTQIADLDFWVRLCFKWDIYIIPENLTEFRIRANEANLSGNKPETARRYAFEELQLLKNYLAIRNNNELLRIFPDYKHKFDENFVPELIPYYVSMIALSVNSPIYQMFALDTLGMLFSNNHLIELLSRVEGFRYIDFIRLTGMYDPMNYVDYHKKALEQRVLMNKEWNRQRRRKKRRKVLDQWVSILLPKDSKRRTFLKKLIKPKFK